MRTQARTEHEQPSATPRRPAGVGPALLALVVLAALPAAALAVAPNQNTLAEITLLLEQARRAPRPEARAERTAPTPTVYTVRIKPAPRADIVPTDASLQAVAATPNGAPDRLRPEPARPALLAMTRAGRTGLPPPAR